MRKRTASLALLALAVQPLQFFGLNNMGAAAAAPMELVKEFEQATQLDAGSAGLQAQALKIPTDDCARPQIWDPEAPVAPCPTFPTPKPLPKPGTIVTTPQVTYYLLPGLGDKTEASSYSSYFAGPLTTFLEGSADGGTAVKTVSPYAYWKSQGIAEQATQLSTWLDSDQNPNNRFILLGHSLGGVRGRQALQFNQGAYISKTAGLVTIGSPHSGAPIINNGNGAGAKLAGTLGVAVGSLYGPVGTWVGASTGLFGASAFISPLTNSAAGRDLAPNSPFMQRLNNPGSNVIPGHIQTLRVSGGNNSVDSLAASFLSNESTGTYYTAAEITSLRGTATKTLFGMGTVSVLLAFFAPWLVIAATAFLAAAYLVQSLPSFWKREVVGEENGDAIVPASSQLLPASAGGGPRSERMLPRAVHSGVYGELQMYNVGEYTDATEFRQALQDFQVKTYVPVSH